MSLESTSQESSVLECGLVTVIDLRFVRLDEISWPAEQLLTGQELCSIESVGWAMKEFRYFSPSDLPSNSLTVFYQI